MFFSIIVCTYNSKDRINQTLANLAELVIDVGLMAELILVDNNSSDGTIHNVERQWSELGSPYPIWTLTEPEQGLVWARLTGIRKSRGNIVIFCDDDNWLPPDYVLRVKQIFEANPKVGIIGSRSEAALPEDYIIPEWFSMHSRAFAVGQQYQKNGIVIDGTIIWGAGMALRGDILRNLIKADFPNFCTGRVGDVIVSGDDAELCAWFLVVGYLLYYDDELVLQHALNIERLKESKLNELYASFQVASGKLEVYWTIAYILNKYKSGNHLIHIIKLILASIYYNYSRYRFFLELKILLPKVKFIDKLISLESRNILIARNAYFKQY